MRLGAPLYGDCSTPEKWVGEAKKHGFRAVWVPKLPDHSEQTIAAYEKAARDGGLVIAETGAWSNPISSDEAERTKAIRHNEEQLAFADKIGARCCVNIAGSRGQKWDGPHKDNLSDETFDMIVETVRKIIDAVKPARAFYTLETMPWVIPDSTESYLKILKAIDRKQFAVHYDPVNVVNSPERYYHNGAMIRDAFAKLGKYIKSCHAKDILLRENLTVHLDEVRPGLGGLDYRTFLQELSKIDADTPLMIEHLPDEKEYTLAADHIRAVGKEIGVAV
jgi:sugar phosphate isomerase/epimerase